MVHEHFKNSVEKGIYYVFSNRQMNKIKILGDVLDN